VFKRSPVILSLAPSFALALLLALVIGSAYADDSIRFNRDVRPIIADRCFACHGPDESARKKNLQFDTEVGLFGTTEDEKAVIVPGDPAKSTLFQRITHSNPDKRMPPEDFHAKLTAEDIEIIKGWIEQGAPWEGHWAYIPPVTPEQPDVSNAHWCRNEIDYYILNRLNEAGLSPSPQAPKNTLIRRVSLDLTGLPPTPDEVDAFLLDNGADAYENVVDRLLASPHYGERMAFPWLDAARYSDTNGYQRDTKRFMWLWRDWVIDAFNDNMPYDQFAIEQLAGDLLPNASISQRVATGFNRNHRINGEGGIIPEEYAVEYVVDRVNTTSAAFMGLTMECSRCHDHKFDPISQKEFYEFYAFFNNVPEQGKGGEQGNDVPVLRVPSEEDIARRARLNGTIDSLKEDLTAPEERLDALQSGWEQDLAHTFSLLDWQIIEPDTLASLNGAELEHLEDNSIFAGGPNADDEVYSISFRADRSFRSLKLELLTDERLADYGPGRADNGNVVVTGFEVDRSPNGEPGVVERVQVVSAIAEETQSGGDFSIRNTFDDQSETGWATNSAADHKPVTAIFVLADSVAIDVGDHITVRIKHESKHKQHNIGRFRLSQSPNGEVGNWAKPTLGPWHYVGPVKNTRYGKEGKELYDEVLGPEEGYDEDRSYGNLRWTEKSEWGDGKVIKFGGQAEAAHYLHRVISVDVPMSFHLSLGSGDAIKVWLDGNLVLAKNVSRDAAPDQETLALYLSPGDHDLMIKIVNFDRFSGFYFRPIEDDGRSLLALMAQLNSPVAERSETAQLEIQRLFRMQDREWNQIKQRIVRMEELLADYEELIPTTMVMAEMDTPRDTYLLNRGVYNNPDESEKLFPDVPAALGEMDSTLPKNRLGFAKWLTDTAHPLTARVRVNHYWQMYFDTGLVKTSEDFGTQGFSPSHPELLDWLATYFMESGWDVKGIQKKIVMSATYRQRSHIREDQVAKDPENILLSRAPRFRLPAEMIRDQALYVSGLINPEVGGPSVMPYQPDKMWSSLTFQNMDKFATNYYIPDSGDSLYRRGLYTFWKRTIPPPRMQIFNAAGREMCSMRQENTNTPMQAMALLNDPTYVEASRHLAQRMILEGGRKTEARVEFGYKLALASDPGAEKRSILVDGLKQYRKHFKLNKEDAEAFINVGDSKPDTSIKAEELAAYTMLASVILNLDEVITRE